MKFTLSWLRDHLEMDESLVSIVETLNSIGLEVEAVDDRSSLSPFVIAEVQSAAQHPEADKLQILSVDIGRKQSVQVVCGAPNARAGMKAVFAAPGTYIPGLDITLGVGRIRGVESAGMLCSERELRLSDAHEGIIELDGAAPLGEQFARYAGLDDPIIDVSITPNRADCTSVYGIARDLAAAGIGRMKRRELPSINEELEPTINVHLCPEAQALCHGYAWRLVKGVHNGASPDWMRKRLAAIGLRPINALVDITNYLTFDIGQPLHVFDADKLKGDLTIRTASPGESLLALNGKVYNLDQQMCIIADDAGVQSIAGIMGGEHTGCDEQTTNVLVEAALWDPISIAQTGRSLGIISDARYRFERGVDPLALEGVLDAATAMIMSACGGHPASKQIVGWRASQPKSIDFDVQEIERLSSLKLAEDDVVDILSRLGFVCRGSNPLTVMIPSWRMDVTCSADLVEEVVRIHGVDKIEPRPLEILQNAKETLSIRQKRSALAKRTLACRGLIEAVTYSFIAHNHALAFGGGDRQLQLVNPIAADLSDMRPSLLPGLINAAERNAARGCNDLGLFEVGDAYFSQDNQQRLASAVRRGTAKFIGSGRFWADESRSVGVFDAKADALSVLDAYGMDIDKLQYETDVPSWYHPGRAAAIKLGPKLILGYFGEFHPLTMEVLGVNAPFCGFEIFIDRLPSSKEKLKSKKPLELSPFQPVHRDFAFIVDNTVEALSVVRAALIADKKLICGAELFDIFTSDTIGAGKKSVAIDVTIQPTKQTLTDKDLENIAQKIISSVRDLTGGVLRA